MLDIDERDIENVNFNNRSRSSSARKRRDSYDYMNTVQMLGEYCNWDNVEHPAHEVLVSITYISKNIHRVDLW